jgi:hypothetical protein
MNATTSSSASLSRIDLKYTPDAILHYFAPLAQQPWAMLLYSGGANHPHNRFDILVAQPILTLTRAVNKPPSQNRVKCVTARGTPSLSYKKNYSDCSQR